MGIAWSVGPLSARASKVVLHTLGVGSDANGLAEESAQLLGTSVSIGPLVERPQ
jgi:hypothetical protein